MGGSTPGARLAPLHLTRLSRQQRILVVAGIVCLLAAAGFVSYRWYMRPTTLTVAVGSQDGEAPKLVAAIAAHLAQTGAPVRLSMKETPSALEAAASFASGAVDLAVVRGDAGDMEQARAVVVVTRGVVLLVAPPGSPIDDLDAVKRVTIGVIGGEINAKLIQILTREYGLDRRNVTFKPLALQDVRAAVSTKQVALLLVVAPLTDKYIALLRGVFSPNGKALPVLVAIGTAAAIAERERAYESFDIPKGTLRGSPPSPSDDVTTLRVPFYLVARKDLNDDLVTTLTESLMNARRELIGQWPMLAQLAAPDIEPDAYLPAHPGAVTFYNGNQVSFLDKWGNLIFLVPMVLGGLVSVAAAARKYLREDQAVPKGDFLDHLYALSAWIRTAKNVKELDQIEDEIDRLLRSQRTAAVADETEASHVTSLNVAAHRLETLISDRRAALAGEQTNAAPSPASGPALRPLSSDRSTPAS
jgi:TRAP-type uncharacterized transport system substrate-binding protein